MENNGFVLYRSFHNGQINIRPTTEHFSFRGSLQTRMPPASAEPLLDTFKSSNVFYLPLRRGEM